MSLFLFWEKKRFSFFSGANIGFVFVNWQYFKFWLVVDNFSHFCLTLSLKYAIIKPYDIIRF